MATLAQRTQAVEGRVDSLETILARFMARTDESIARSDESLARLDESIAHSEDARARTALDQFPLAAALRNAEPCARRKSCSPFPTAAATSRKGISSKSGRSLMTVVVTV